MWLCFLESTFPHCIFLEGRFVVVLQSREQAAQLPGDQLEPFSAWLAADQAEPSHAGQCCSDSHDGERAPFTGNRSQTGQVCQGRE